MKKNQIHFAVTTSRRLPAYVYSTELISSFSSSASTPAFFIKIFCFSFRKTASHNALRPLFAFIRVNLVYTDNPSELCRMEIQILLSEMEDINLTPEQYERYIQTVDEFQQLRTLSREEKIKIIDDILKAPFLDLRSDWAFKYVFGGHPDLLKMLLNDFLPEPVESVTVLPNELPHNRPDDKNIILDVLCRLGDGREIIVEMQRKGHDSFRNRMFYYGADLVSKQLKSGAYYDRLCPVYVICFMDFTLKHRQSSEGKIMFVYEFRERDTGERYADLMSIYLCELPRLKKRSMKQMNPVEEWFYILKRMTTFAEVPEGMDGRFAPLLETARTRQLPETEKLHYLRAMISEEEKEDIAKFYRAEGREQGLAEGLEKGKKEVARQMKKMGLSIAQIVQASGLPEEVVKGL